MEKISPKSYVFVSVYVCICSCDACCLIILSSRVLSQEVQQCPVSCPVCLQPFPPLLSQSLTHSFCSFPLFLCACICPVFHFHSFFQSKFQFVGKHEMLLFSSPLDVHTLCFYSQLGFMYNRCLLLLLPEFILFSSLFC